MKKSIIALFILIILVLICTVNAIGIDIKYNELSEEDEKETREYVEFNPLESEPEKRSFKSFSVNENGEYVLVTGPWSNTDPLEYVTVYDANFEYMYGFSTKVNENMYVDWSADGSILLYLPISEKVLSINQFGEILYIKGINKEACQENRDFWKSVSESAKTKTVVTEKYTYKSSKAISLFNFLLTPCSKIIRTDLNGNSETVFDVSGPTVIRVCLLIGLFVVIIGGATVVAIILNHKSKKRFKEYKASLQNNKTGDGSMS